MPSQKNRTAVRSRRKARKVPALAAAVAGRGYLSGASRSVDLVAHLLDALLLVLAAAYLVLLWRQASHAVFVTDECFHAYLAEWIALHHRLPRALPELYSGLAYFYPPLFHLIGAALTTLAGVAALKYLNVVLMGVLFALLYALPFPEVPKTPRRWALLLCLGNPALAVYVVRFYAETLSTLLTVLVTVLLLRLRARPRIRDGIVLGVGVGLALMAKQPAVLLPCLLALLVGVYAVRRERSLATALLVAFGTAVVVALPYFARNQALIGSPFYPAVTTDAQRTLDALNTRAFSQPAGLFYRSALGAAGPLIPWICMAALAWSLVRRRWDLRTSLLALCLGFVLVAPMVSRFEPRHLNPFIAVVALLACLVLYDGLKHRRAIGLLIQVLLIGWGATTLIRMPDYRQALNAPPEHRDPFRAVGQYVPAGETVLSLWTYDTFYYSRRDATWPIPWSKSAEEIRLFDEPDPARFLATLDRLSIRYLVVPRAHQPVRFDGVNYTESFVACVIQLVRGGQLRVLWQSPTWAVVGRVR